jgi:pimeloyl-ACP methyl ester carboxylesterase
MHALCFAVVLAAALLPNATHSRAAAQNTPHASPSFATAPDGIRIAYEAHGSGAPGAPALIFVHGWSCDRSYWNGQLAAFSPAYKVVAVDLAGHGESALGRRDWSMAAFGGDVAAVVTKLNLTRVILIGHSMGGDVIAEAARQLPGRVVGMIWVDVYKQLGPGRSPDSVQAFVSRMRPHFVDSTRALVRSMFIPTSNPALVERIANDMSSAPPEVAIPSVESARNYSRQIPHTLDDLKLPVIAINPDNAPTDVPSMQQHGVEVVIMSGVGHFLFLEDPERFNALLRTAIGKLTRSHSPYTSGHAPPASASQPRIDSTLTRLYRAFSFEKGREPEWTTIRSAFLSGATIVDPIQERTLPHAIGVTEFIEEFRNAVKREASFREGFAERIVATRVDQYGHIAHAYVTFEGYVPGDTTARTRGVDSIQLILAGDDWKVASFITQFENKDLPLPPAFRAASTR